MDGCQTTNDPWRVQWKNVDYPGYRYATYATYTGGCCITLEGIQENTGYQYGWLP